MIEVKKVKSQPGSRCTSCYPTLKNQKNPRYLYVVTVHHNPHQSSTFDLCKNCLNDLGCKIADILDPVPAPKKLKSKKISLPFPVSLKEEDMDSGNIMHPRARR